MTINSYLPIIDLIKISPTIPRTGQLYAEDYYFLLLSLLNYYYFLYYESYSQGYPHNRSDGCTQPKTTG